MYIFFHSANPGKIRFFLLSPLAESGHWLLRRNILSIVVVDFDFIDPYCFLKATPRNTLQCFYFSRLFELRELSIQTKLQGRIMNRN